MISVNKKGQVWVFAEQHHGKLEETGLELLSKARELADKLGVQMAAMLLGSNVGTLTQTLVRYGADVVYLAQHPMLEHYQTNSYAKVIFDLIHKYEPQICLFGATVTGRDLAPRIASAVKAGLTADCTDLQIGEHQVGKDGPIYKDLLMQVRPAFGGNIIATIINYDRWPQMATVREGVMQMPVANVNHKGQVIEIPVHLSNGELPLEILNEVRQEKKVNLKASRIIVAGGAGVGSKDNFKLVWGLANALGGAPAGTRAAIDLGFIDRDHQVGQTGTTVRPSLYIAVGISGAIQHQAGMQGSQKIIAINNDPEAPIFGIAHYKIIGDLNDVLPRMIKAIKDKI